MGGIRTIAGNTGHVQCELWTLSGLEALEIDVATVLCHYVNVLAGREALEHLRWIHTPFPGVESGNEIIPKLPWIDDEVCQQQIQSGRAVPPTNAGAAWEVWEIF